MNTRVGSVVGTVSKNGIMVVLWACALVIAVGCGNNNAGNAPAPIPNGLSFGSASCGGVSGTPVTNGTITGQLNGSYMNGWVAFILGTTTNTAMVSTANVVGCAQVLLPDGQNQQTPFNVNTGMNPGQYYVPQQGTTLGYLQNLTMTGSANVPYQSSPLYGGYGYPSGVTYQAQQIQVQMQGTIDTSINHFYGCVYVSGYGCYTSN